MYDYDYNVKMDEFYRRAYSPRPDDSLDPCAGVCPTYRVISDKSRNLMVSTANNVSKNAASSRNSGVGYLFFILFALYLCLSPIHVLLLSLHVPVFGASLLDFLYDFMRVWGRGCIVIVMYLLLFLWGVFIPFTKRRYSLILFRAFWLLAAKQVLDPDLAECGAYFLMNYIGL